MDIANITALKNTLAGEPKTEGLQLRVGQTLTATVQTKLSSNLFELLVNNQRLQARSDQALSTGQKLRLVVEKLDYPVVLRAITTNSDPALENKLHLQAIRSDWLKSSLPKPASLEPLLKQLNQLNTTQQSGLPKITQQELGKFIERFQPILQLATKTGIEKAFKQSGLFYEATLASMAEQSTQQGTAKLLSNDLKAQLMRIGELLQQQTKQNVTNQTKPLIQTPNTQDNSNKSSNLPSTMNLSANLKTTNSEVATPSYKASGPVNINQSLAHDSSMPVKIREWLQPIEQALNKVQLQQNQAIALDRNESINWNFSIPILDDQVLHMIDLNIYQDGQTKHDADSHTWRIEISMEIDDLGSIQARLSLYGEQLSLILFAEQAATAELMQQHIDVLNQDISSTGLAITDIRCVCGQMESKAPNPNQPTLVDVHL